jgi:hypothetical protein
MSERDLKVPVLDTYNRKNFSSYREPLQTPTNNHTEKTRDIQNKLDTRRYMHAP